MDVVKRRVTTYCRISRIVRVGTISPCIARTAIRPCCIVDIEVLASIIDIRVIIQIAIGCAEQQVIHEGVLHKILLGNVPAEGERIRDGPTVALRKTG